MMMNPPPRRRRAAPAAPHPRRAGFTLIELIVVITIIALLIAALGGAAALVFKRTATSLATETQLRNIAFGIEAFERDLGYLPPLLSDLPTDLRDSRRRLTVPGLGGGAPSDAIDELRRARYHSMFTLPVYLVGVGDVNGDTALEGSQDELDPSLRVLDDGVEGPGIRNPGPDRSWGGARDRRDHRAARTGRVYGPYIDVDNAEDALREAQKPDYRANREDVENQERMFVIQDRWGAPIRYYRSWPVRNEDAEYSLEDAPLELIDIDAFREEPSSKAGFDRPLLTGEFALLSAGQNRLWGESFEEIVGSDVRPADQTWLWGRTLGVGTGEYGYENEALSKVVSENELERIISDNVRVIQ